jgi:hypothetical protein
MSNPETQNAVGGVTEIRIAGKTHHVMSTTIAGWPVVATGRWLRTAQLKDEELVEGNFGDEVPCLVDTLRASRFPADIFSFAQKLPDIVPKHRYHSEFESWAVVQVTSFDDWWKTLPTETRKNVRRAEKRGVTVKVVPFGDDLIRHIKAIYDETPIRQGRPFWHFQEDLATVKRAMATYLDRSDFICAYLRDELIGFIKLTYVDRVATIMQILTKNAHQDARPANALLAKTVDLCHQRGISFLLYGQYMYGRRTKSQLTEFKRRNGFDEVKLPHYYIPLNIRGWLAINLGFHRRLRDRLPALVVDALLNLRSQLYRLRIARPR